MTGAASVPIGAGGDAGAGVAPRSGSSAAAGSRRRAMPRSSSSLRRAATGAITSVAAPPPSAASVLRRVRERGPRGLVRDGARRVDGARSVGRRLARGRIDAGRRLRSRLRARRRRRRRRPPRPRSRSRAHRRHRQHRRTRRTRRQPRATTSRLVGGAGLVGSAAASAWHPQSPQARHPQRRRARHPRPVGVRSGVSSTSEPRRLGIRAVSSTASARHPQPRQARHPRPRRARHRVSRGSAPRRARHPRPRRARRRSRVRLGVGSRVGAASRVAAGSASARPRLGLGVGSGSRRRGIGRAGSASAPAAASARLGLASAAASGSASAAARLGVGGRGAQRRLAAVSSASGRSGSTSAAARLGSRLGLGVGPRLGRRPGLDGLGRRVGDGRRGRLRVGARDVPGSGGLRGVGRTAPPHTGQTGSDDGPLLGSGGLCRSSPPRCPGSSRSVPLLILLPRCLHARTTRPRESTCPG